MTYRSRIAAGMAVILLIVVYTAGHWPGRQKRMEAEREAAALRARATPLDEHVRAAQLHAALLNLIDESAAMNYGRARDLSSAFFDRVRAEAMRTTVSPLRAAYDEILAKRDVVTAALARGEADVLQPLRESERNLRPVVGAARL